MTETLKTAQLLHASGVSAVPTNAEKIPPIKWKPFMSGLPTPGQLVEWFSGDARIALVAGKVQCLDFDEKYSKGIFRRYSDRAEETGLRHLTAGLILQQTPTGGFHFVWQCAGARIGNTKLASKANHETMIETRGDGGYFLIAPSPGYTLQSGDWSSIPSISEDDRDALLNLARTFDETPPVDAHPEPVRVQPAGELAPDATPGDDFDFRADVPALLKQHGWKPAGGSGKYWTRPGKNKGISASWDVVPGRFFVFSSSTPFEPNHTYRPWHVYAVLECNGDYSKAASELRRQGFGGVAPRKSSANATAEDWASVDQMPGIEESPGEPPGVEGVDPAGDAPTNETEDDKIRRYLKMRAFDPSKTPPPIRPIFTLGGVVICTPGNLTAITAQAKVGKSALVSALTAASMTDGSADCLSAHGFNVTGKAFLYFDTEQSKDDFWHAVNRAKRRSGLETTPDWLHAYAIGDLPASIGRKALAVAMADFASLHDGIHAVILDGVADLVLDVNDAEDCNNIVAELFQLATRYDCSIICVIHKNPGSDKTRGHLGSQIERKAETNLTLEKDDEVTIIWSAKQRRAPIDKKHGPRFRWDDALQMHVTVEQTDGKRLTKTMAEWKRYAQAAFVNHNEFNYTDLSAALAEASGRAASTCNNRVTQLLDAGVLEYVQSRGIYLLKKDDSSDSSTR